MDRAGAARTVAKLRRVRVERGASAEEHQAASGRADALSRRWGLTPTEVGNACRALAATEGPRLRAPIPQPEAPRFRPGGTTSASGGGFFIFARVTFHP